MHFGEFRRRPIQRAKGFVSSFREIRRDNRLRSGVERRPAEKVTQCPKVGGTVLIFAGKIAGCINEQIGQFRLYWNGKTFE